MKIIIAICAVLLLSACTVRPDPLKVKVPGVPGVTIETEGGSGKGFCPPGQAKKGNCR
jgi:hypothetical protein